MGSSLLLKGGTSTPKSIVETISVAHSFAVGDVVRYDVATSAWTKAQANSAENSEVAGVVSAVNSTTSFDVTYSGFIDLISLAAITSPVLFLDSSAAGGLTASPPSAIGSVVKPVLTKTSNGSGYIVSNYLGTQIGGSSTVAIDEIQPVGTIMPFAGSTIPDSWLECNGNSYAIGTYPQLYAKLQNSSGDRVPAYGYVATLFGTNVSTALAAGDYIQYKATADAFTGTGSPFAGAATNASLLAIVLSVTSTSAVVQVIPTYSSTTKNFTINNTVFAGGGFVGSETGTGNYRAYSTSSAFKAVTLTITSAAITHFNTPDLRGRFAIGVNTSALPSSGDLEIDTSNNSAISGIYSLGSEGGQESTVVDTAGVLTGTTNSKYTTTSSSNTGLLSNMPPYTVVRYIIKATPYTRAAIIDGIDIPYTSLLVGDLRDGSLRPGGSGEDLLFKTNDGSSGVERMRLTNTPTNAAPGSVLIGTTTHISTYNTNYRLLEVAKTSGNGGGVVVTRSNAVTLEMGVDEGTLNAGVLGTRTVHPLILRTDTTERMRIDANGQVNIASTTASTSVNTGGLTLGGGLGVAGALYLGSGITAAGGISMGGALTVGGSATITSTASSTSSNSGSLVVRGGAGIAGALNVGGGITAARLDVSGGIKLTSGGFNTSTFVNITDTASSNSTGTGALIVAGGVGIAGALNLGSFSGGNVCVKPSTNATRIYDSTSEATQPNPAVGGLVSLRTTLPLNAATPPVVGRTSQTWLVIIKTSSGTSTTGIYLVTGNMTVRSACVAAPVDFANGDNVDIVGWRIA